MTDTPIRLPRILLTNDDGIDDEGLRILSDIAETLADEVWVVAPMDDQSGAAQRVSLRAPLQAKQLAPRRYAVSGTPSDCVALALGHLMKDAKPSLILSGVNATSNVADELNLSGTVGAAMTGLMLGVPAIAISQAAMFRHAVPWATTRAILPTILQKLLTEGWRKETALCLNIPAMPPEKIMGYRWARQGHKNIAAIRAEKRTSPRGEDYFWLSLLEKDPAPNPSGEMTVLRKGFVSVVALSPDRSVEVNKPDFYLREPEKKPKKRASAMDEVLNEAELLEADNE